MNPIREAILERLRQAVQGWPGTMPLSEADFPARGADPDPMATFARVVVGLGADQRLARGTAGIEGEVRTMVQDLGARTAVCWHEEHLTGLGMEGILTRCGVQVLKPESQDGRFGDLAARADLGVTWADAVVAESGTVAVRTGPGRERSTSLLPSCHLAVVTPQTTILPTVPDLAAWLSGLADERGTLPSAVHLISGPSSTGDIELVKVKGVHGPLRLMVLRILPD